MSVEHLPVYQSPQEHLPPPMISYPTKEVKPVQNLNTQWVAEQNRNTVTIKPVFAPYTTSDTQYFSASVNVQKQEQVAHQPEENRLYGIADFRLRYTYETPRQEIMDDLTSYLGEYRIHVQKYDFKQYFTRGTDGKLALRAKPNGISMVEIADNAIKDRVARNLSTYKESADRIGIKEVNTLINKAEDGETIFYASPPDPEVGFEYGFIYKGTVKRINDEEKEIHMRAIRIDNAPTLEQFNQAFRLLTQKDIQFSEPNDFIKIPQLVRRTVDPSEVDFVLQGTFDFTPDAESQQRMQAIMAKLKPYQEQFIDSITSGVSKEEQEREFFHLENKAIQFTKEYDEDRANGQVTVYTEERHISREEYKQSVAENSHRPPEVNGTCAENQQARSADMYGMGGTYGSQGMSSTVESAGKDDLGERAFNCPVCGARNVRPHNQTVSNCQKCGSDKVAC